MIYENRYNVDKTSYLRLIKLFQVRRIVGTLIAVGREKITLKEVKFMLEVPSHLSWNPRVHLAPSYGLYLCQVEYSPKDLEIIEEPINKKEIIEKV